MSHINQKLLKFDFQKIGKSVLNIERANLKILDQYINYDFQCICKTLLNCQGKVILMGVGKSGFIAKKISSTFSSTGTPSFFLHPNDASHGDLGTIMKNDIVFFISNSGETYEIIQLVSRIQKKNVKIISITKSKNSSIAKISHIHLLVKISQEACPFGLSPTSSTTAVLIIGDALAITLLKAKKFTIKNFYFSHPGGNIGKNAFLYISDIIKKNTIIPIVQEKTSLQKVLLKIINKKLDIIIILNNMKKIVGVCTKDDIYKILSMNYDFKNTNISNVMNKKYIYVYDDILAIDALDLMNEKNIKSVIVCNRKNELVGIVHTQDILNENIF